jgi:hypothetical protein
LQPLVYLVGLGALQSTFDCHDSQHTPCRQHRPGGRLPTWDPSCMNKSSVYLDDEDKARLVRRQAVWAFPRPRHCGVRWPSLNVSADQRGTFVCSVPALATGALLPTSTKRR